MGSLGSRGEVVGAQCEIFSWCSVSNKRVPKGKISVDLTYLFVFMEFGIKATLRRNFLHEIGSGFTKISWWCVT